MDRLAAFLALNGCLALVATMIGGLLLYRSIVDGRRPEDWHLVHAGGTSRGVMLLALAATIRFAELPQSQLELASKLIVYFVWASILAMFLRAATGHLGYSLKGPALNRLIFLLYASGVAAVFVGFAWLIYGFIVALLA